MTRAFLDSLYSTCTGGVVELRALPSGARAWTTPGDWRPLGPFITAQVRAGQNVALGIATRADTTNGTAANVRECPAIWCDVEDPQRARAHLAGLPFRPAWIVSSGRGVHAYFQLKEPADLTHAPTHVQVSAVLRRLASYLHGDDTATDVSRVLRLPGAWSFKYDTPRPVTVLEQHPTTINLSELDDFLPGEITRDHERIPENRLRVGRRNDVLHGLIRSLRFRGLPPRVIVRAVETINADWCDPPLPATELSTLLHYALAAADRPDFTNRHRRDVETHR